jgi:hypothetical protein
MSAISSFAEFKQLCQSNSYGVFCVGMNNGSVNNNGLGSIFAREQYQSGTVTAPSTAVSLDSTHVAALLQNPKLPTGLTGKQFWLCESEFIYNCGNVGAQRCSALLLDRLCHQGGLSGTVTTAQTTNLPTAALPRYTSGDGVQAAVEIYSQIGSTSTTLTISYTNQAGVSGQVSQPIVIGGSSNNSVGVMLPIPLADGDTGVQSVQSVTLAGSTLTAGNFGITLFKRLALLPPHTGNFVERQGYRNYLFGGGAVEILPGACLQLAIITPDSNAGYKTYQGSLNIGQK